MAGPRLGGVGSLGGDKGPRICVGIVSLGPSMDFHALFSDSNEFRFDPNDRPTLQLLSSRFLVYKKESVSFFHRIKFYLIFCNEHVLSVTIVIKSISRVDVYACIQNPWDERLRSAASSSDLSKFVKPAGELVQQLDSRVDS